MNRSDMEQLWSEHLDGEFSSKDVDATLATMLDDADVNHVPVPVTGVDLDVAGDDHHGHRFFLSLGYREIQDRAGDSNSSEEPTALAR